MHKNSSEENITNLGLVPEGLTFAQATEIAKKKRKFFINEHEGGHRLTICDTLRMTLREINNLPDSKEREQIKEYLSAAYDYGKRMDARMKYLKSVLEENGIDYIKGGTNS